AARLLERGGGIGNCFLGVDSCGGFLVDGVPGRGLRALARVERVVQRLTVIALIDGAAGALQGVFSGGGLLARGLIGAGGARGVDRALRLLHFPVGGIGAGGGGQRGGDREREQCTTNTPHAVKYTARSTRTQPAPSRTARDAKV